MKCHGADKNWAHLNEKIIYYQFDLIFKLIFSGLNYGEGVQRRESGHTPLFTPPPMIHHGRVHSLTTPPGKLSSFLY